MRQIGTGTYARLAQVMSRKREYPWERSDFAERFTLLPWSVQFDKSLNSTDKDVFTAYAAECFICGCNIVRLSNSRAARFARIGVRSVVRSVPKLLNGGHLEVMGKAIAGRVTAHKLTSPLFSSNAVIMATATGGSEVIAREALEDLRKRFSQRRRIAQ